MAIRSIASYTIPKRCRCKTLTGRYMTIGGDARSKFVRLASIIAGMDVLFLGSWVFGMTRSEGETHERVVSEYRVSEASITILEKDMADAVRSRESCERRIVENPMSDLYFRCIACRRVCCPAYGKAR